MGALGNLDWERFCQEAHKRIWAGEKRQQALGAAYVDCIYSGDKTDRESAVKRCKPNGSRLANANPVVKARLAELHDYSAKLCGIDSQWATLKLKEMVEFNLDDFLAQPGRDYFDLANVSREKIGLIAELTIEEDKIKIKAPDRHAALALMARIQGWEAASKLALTDPSGKEMRPMRVEFIRAEDGRIG